MPRLLFCSLAIAFAAPLLAQAATNSIFEDCGAALDAANYRALWEFYEAHSEELRPAQCARIGQGDYLALVTTTGGAGDGLYRYEAKTATYSQLRGRNYRVDQEFAGSDGRRYALMRGDVLLHGVWNYGFEVLSIEPHPDGHSNLQLQPLVTAHENPVTGMCGDGGDGEEITGVASSIRSRSVDERPTGLQISFEVVEEDCQTGKQRNVHQEFVLRDGRFVELKKVMQ